MNINENDKDKSNTYSQKCIVKNYYVANSTLVNVIQGSVVICNMETLCCYTISEGLYFLKKGIKVGLSSITSKEKPKFHLIQIPAYILKGFCAGFNDIKSKAYETEIHNVKNEWVIKATDIIFPDAFIKKIKKVSQDKLDIQHSTDIIYSFYYLLSHFTTGDELPTIIRSSSENTLKEKVYNTISNNLSKEWTLGSMAECLFLSPSSLKRKLQYEGATFSEICLSARMNAAAKLLRQSNMPVQKISQMCGYENYSYFITVFKKNFNITPKKYMGLFQK
ncbi:AraC family transcriptional regulator [Escherichia coli O120:H1]|uniref:helix-turn-helix domain-containing protein n=1 Tax=Escherichia coli TaxID=562 RepID=UPI00199BB949|nr:helix-turn-helix domain-containing protein [Escherichia coli]CAD5782499.1 transcriptional activator of the bfp operon [Escherichia coli]CAD5794364.1 transcriptional activator of the bfp operon [Escherichia coli]